MSLVAPGLSLSFGLGGPAAPAAPAAVPAPGLFLRDWFDQQGPRLVSPEKVGVAAKLTAIGEAVASPEVISRTPAVVGTGAALGVRSRLSVWGRAVGVRHIVIYVPKHMGLMRASAYTQLRVYPIMLYEGEDLQLLGLSFEPSILGELGEK